MAHVSALYVYPVKACAGVSVSSAELLARGLRHDRRFMLVDADGAFVTQREEPRLSLVAVEIGADGLALRTAEGEAHVAFGATEEEDAAASHAAPSGAETRAVKVWKDVVPAEVASPAASALVSSWLSREVTLVRMPASTRRAVSPKYAGPADVVSFADGFPVLVASDASLRELNARLREPVPMDRFRPNVVLEGTAPFAEDERATLRFGDDDGGARLSLVKPCGRCSVVTVEQTTGISGKEPLATLAQYRKRGAEVYFAMNALVASRGTLRKGDPVAFLPLP